MTGSAEARVVVRTAEDLHTEISTSEHELVADEPTSLGGTNAGPNPYDYLLASEG
jgi:putative redox protein